MGFLDGQLKQLKQSVQIGTPQGHKGKLTFIFYPLAALPGQGFSYTPMYNPTSFSIDHEIKHDAQENLLTGNMVKKFLSANPRTVSMELFFDGTGASPSSLGVNTNEPGGINSVENQINNFLLGAYKISGAIHRPNYIMIIWGSFIMTGVLASANVTYTMFAPDGSPLRAKMSITIKEHTESRLLVKALTLQSPDLSKSITVEEGDTLPLLCYREYGDASYYLKVAQANNLNNYRHLKQGAELLFPPINDLI